MRIGVDLMGADSAPLALFQGVLSAAAQISSSLVVYLTKDVQRSFPAKHSSIKYVVVDDFISMDEAPVAAVRTKPKSSLVIGLCALAKGDIDAFVTCGNTGAVVAGSVLFLKKFPKILRPGLVATLPSKKGPVVVIDVGGSPTAKARHLMQFSTLGIAYHTAMYGTQKPSVGLLNIGSESKKGSEEVRIAYQQLANMHGPWTFSGNVEGRDLYSGDVDVVVTDGFTGNILLKTAEGTAAFVFDMIKDKKVSMDASCEKFCEEQQSGALLCGIEGTIIKVHGNASAQSLHQAIVKAALCVDKDITSHIKSFLERIAQ